ncbi:MAG: hypothetical protein U0325_19125 [Polyangiales bacterium]
MSAAEVAARFADALRGLGAAHGMTAATASPAQNAIYHALAAHLGWFRPRAVDPALRNAIPPVPEGFSVRCEAPEQSFSPGSPSRFWDLACGCVALAPDGTRGLAITSQREGVTLCADERGWTLRPWGDPLHAPGTPSRTAPWSSLVRLLRGHDAVVSLTLADWPAAGAWRGAPPASALAAALDLLRGSAGLAVANTYGEAQWQGVATALVARDPTTLAAAVRDAQATRALPGEPCPRCGDPLVDPDRERRTPPQRTPDDDETVRWWVSGVYPTCARCGVRFASPHLREVTWIGETVGYRRG